ncbi:hypothetical protein CORMATOL_00142 [Corynebacterium matruchotii ATCC 33806]|uniref:Uncharacterized protein n=1 Tax=Corynebacterium matruchotii ATCC 33806 TaxID=566549 RepID=C0DZK2_9CORY|nr:hypothetical protein CORMATOL_00142 [Corynebacterium matruchotii ATCC 33806]
MCHADLSRVACGARCYRIGLTCWKSFEKHPRIIMAKPTYWC